MQQNLQAQQMMDINAAFGREVFSPSMIIPKLNITGKGEIIPYLQQQEQQAAAVQQDAQNIQHAFENAKLQELVSKAAANLATARERHGRAEADIGLFEERLSEITHNRAMATKAKMESLEKLVDVIAKYGEIETSLKMHELQNFDMQQEFKENEEKADAKRTSLANEFVSSIMGANQQMPQPQGEMAQL
jgi:predicted  nucleic acid-binding Zn-ribbon protein